MDLHETPFLVGLDLEYETTEEGGGTFVVRLR